MLYTVILMSMVSALAISFGHVANNQIENEAGSKDWLQSELNAESGLAYVRRQMARKPEWQPTADVAAGDLEFTAERYDTPDPILVHEAQISIEGRNAESRFRLEVRMEVDPGDPLRRTALGVLGPSAMVHNTQIEGELVIADAHGSVLDWNQSLNDGAGGWEPAPVSSLGPFQFTSTDLQGSVFHYANRSYSIGDAEYEMGAPVLMPAWNLATYLEPGTDRVFYDSPGTLQDLTSEETVVVTLQPGETLTLNNVDFRGGLVVAVPADYDPRSGPRNVIECQQVVNIGGGSGGVHRSLALLAPGAEFRGQSGQGVFIRGLVLLNELNTIVHTEVTGQLLVINDIKNFNNGVVKIDPIATEDPPPGWAYSGPPPSTQLERVWEDFD